LFVRARGLVVEAVDLAAVLARSDSRQWSLFSRRVTSALRAVSLEVTDMEEGGTPSRGKIDAEVAGGVSPSACGDVEPVDSRRC
jgi:hypothetical protein